jgi:serine/threonine-protein kinase RsbW
MKTPDNIHRKESTDKLEIQAPGKSRAVRHIRALVADLARKVGFPAEEVDKIQMAVGEACDNVIEHAYAPDKHWCSLGRPDICMEIRTEKGRLVIEIHDHGERFDFANYQPADIEELIREMKPGGYGISIMRKFMDEVQYSSSEQTGNTLRLVKYLKKS